MSKTRNNNMDFSKKQNWFTSALAVETVRDALLNFIKKKIQELHQDILNKLPPATVCNSCSLESILPCPTKNICRLQRGKCQFHKSKPQPCPNKVCDIIRNEIEKVHRHSNPAWENTDPSLWCSDPWQLAKCFMPKEGYCKANTADKTDFNGIIYVLLNCKRFESFFKSDLTKENSICHKVGNFLS